MRNGLQKLGLLGGLGLVALLGACGDDDDGKKDDTKDTKDTKDSAEVGTDTTTQTEVATEVTPDTTEEVVETTYATLTFSIDDTANKSFNESDKLVWKGSFTWDDESNVITFDSTWGGGAGPYPLLFDDGPAPGGHEAPGETSGDHIWTTVVKIATPKDADLKLEYGAAFGDGAGNWIWHSADGKNGTVTVPKGSTDQIDAVGLTIDPFGTFDLILTLDASNDGANLATGFKVAQTDVKVKSSAWYWKEVALVDDGTKGDKTSGDKIFTFRLSQRLSEIRNSGLLKGHAQPQFVFVLGGVEYKVGGAPPTDGVKAWLVDGATEVEVEVANLADGDKNTYPVWPDMVGVTFEIDDSANMTYEAADNLEWKGSFKFTAPTGDEDYGSIAFDGAWGGPYVKLYDDGPPPAGNEAPGAVAGDHKWTTMVWVSNLETKEYEYGAQRDGSSWIWTSADGKNGKFKVEAGALAAIKAAGLVIAAHGTIDFRLELDVSNNGANLFAGFQGVDYTGKVKVKGSAWAWATIALVDDGTKGDKTASDGKYTFVLSENIGKHDGLLKLGDKPEFIFVLGPVSGSGDGSEYKNGSGEGAKEGVKAWSDYSAPGDDACVALTNSCMEETVEVAGNKNTMVTIGN